MTGGSAPERSGTTRRRFLIGAAAAVSAVGVARLLGLSLRRGTTAQPSAGADRSVALVGCERYAEAPLRAAVDRGLALCPPPDVRGKRVVLKPNFVEHSPERPVTTSVELLRHTGRAFRDLGAATVVVAEGPGHNRDTDEVWTRTGLYAMAAEEGFEVVDLNVDHLVLTRMKTFPEGGDFVGRALEQLYLPRTVRTADLLVSMPKLKTHHWAGFTLGMKNLFGVVPSMKYGWPKNVLHRNRIARSVVELAASIAPGYTIVDGVEGMEGDGPIMGTAVASRCLAFGRSVFTVDWTGARLMGLDPARTDVVRLASVAGLGPLEEPPILGESIRTFERAYAIPPRFDALRV